MTDSKTVIWVESLNLVDIITLSIESVFTGALVRYDEHKATGTALRMLATMRRAGFLSNFQEARLTLNLTDADGYALNYHLEDDIDRCLNAFCDRYIPGESAKNKSAVRLYLVTYLEYRMTFVVMVAARIAAGDASDRNVLLLRRHPVNSVMLDHYRDKGYSIRQSIALRDILAHYFKPLARVAAIVISRLWPAPAAMNIGAGRPSLWVEYAHTDTFGPIFDRKRIDETKFDIVYYIDRNDKAPLSDQTAVLDKRSLDWIDLRFRALVKQSRIGIRGIISMLGAYIKAPAGTPLWFRTYLIESSMWYLLYKPVFSRFNVRALVQHQEASWIKAPQLRAVEDAGGIMIGYHWSNYPFYKVAFYSAPQTVFFVWGKLISEWMEKRGNQCRYLLPSGLWIDTSNDKAMEPRLKDGLEFVIAVFDTTAVYNIYSDEKSMSAFYLKVVDMIEKNRRWGALMKNKYKSLDDIGRLPDGGQIVERLRRLIDDGRIVNLDMRMTPFAAARDADISVCASLNSAGLMAASLGYRAVHWDCAGFLNHPFYRDAGQKFLCADLGSLEDAVTRASKGDTSIGDFSAWARRFSHFADREGSSRIGSFIQDYLVFVADTGDVGKSVESAVKKYRIDNSIGDDFYSSEGLWKDERFGSLKRTAQ